MFYREAVFFLRTIAAVAVISATSVTAYSQPPAAGSDNTATSSMSGSGAPINDFMTYDVCPPCRGKYPPEG